MTIREFFLRRPRTAWVFGGGGNLGAVQVGQVRALLERGIVPDVVVGCSVGALNAAAVAGDPTLRGTERLAALWRSLRRPDIFPAQRLGHRPWLFMRPGRSAYPDDGLRRLVDWLPYERFEQANVPLWVVATSLRTGRERWFGSGEVRKPLLASAALPGVFPPVEIDGEDYIDGGVVNNVPISKAIELRARRVYVLDVGNLERDRPEPKRPYEVLMQAVSIARAARFRMEREHVPDGVELVRLPAPDAGRLRFDDFSRTVELMEHAYAKAAAFLEGAGVATA